MTKKDILKLEVCLKSTLPQNMFILKSCQIGHIITLNIGALIIFFRNLPEIAN